MSRLLSVGCRDWNLEYVGVARGIPAQSDVRGDHATRVGVAVQLDSAANPTLLGGIRGVSGHHPALPVRAGWSMGRGGFEPPPVGL